jgi:hypothetical protein
MSSLYPQVWLWFDACWVTVLLMDIITDAFLKEQSSTLCFCKNI